MLTFESESVRIEGESLKDVFARARQLGVSVAQDKQGRMIQCTMYNNIYQDSKGRVITMSC